MVEDNVKDILKKYSRKIEQQMGDYNQKSSGKNSSGEGGDFSQEFVQFKQDMMPDLSKYERWTKTFGNFIKLKLARKDEERLQKDLTGAHLDVSPGEVVGLAITGFFIFGFLGTLLTVGVSDTYIIKL